MDPKQDAAADGEIKIQALETLKPRQLQNPAFSAEDSKVSVEPNTATPQMASVVGSCGTAGFTPAIFMSPKKDSKPR